MTIFAANDLSKSFNHGLLFEGVSFGLEQGERIGLIGKNGAGKTTLLRIIAGMDIPDTGEVIFNNDVTKEYLTQDPQFDRNELIIDAVMKAKARVFRMIEEYNQISSKLQMDHSDHLFERQKELLDNINIADGWALERESQTILSKLGIYDSEQNVGTLSGGLKKRVALAAALVSNPTLLIMDEPTNHLDADSVQWLQDRLQNSSNSIIFVTHDRYFLDAISTKIIELDQKRIFSFPGNYEHYLEQKESIVDAQISTIDHIKSKLKAELAWLQKGAKARRTKQKSRIDWISELEKETYRPEEKKIKIELGSKFLGSRIIDAHNISKKIGGKILFNNFTYVAKPKDRIGIIGPNGAGKSTLLNVLSGRMPSDGGSLKIGASSNIGYFTQDSSELKPTQSVIGTLREVAEYIDVGVGRDRFLTARDLLNKFLFPHRQHSAFVSTLSGGERRRLQILRMLMNNPNVILLDEPTNDLDIHTLNAFESYLDDFYGVLLVVSHDRAFLDRTVNFIWAFDGKGGIKEYPGNYSNYLEKKEQEEKLKRSYSSSSKKANSWKDASQKKPNKLSYKDQLELEKLESIIPEMEKKKSYLEEQMNSGSISDYVELENMSKELVDLELKLDDLTMKWLEISEKKEEIENSQKN
jgi:ATP-binding cassette subfamily F protein uup